MAIIDWNNFKANHPNTEKAFEDLSYRLFCRKYGVKEGLWRYKNQTGIETEPAEKDGIWIGFQAKFFDHTISEKKIIDSLRKAKGKNPQLGKIDLYVHPEFSESSKPSEKQAKCQQKIEKAAKKLGIIIEWQMPSHIEIQLNQAENSDITEDYFRNNSKEIIGSLNGIGEAVSSNLELTRQLCEERQKPGISEEDILKDFRTASGDFNSVRSYFGDMQDSYIRRKEVNLLMDWIEKPVEREGGNIAILTGNAGMGKTVVMKEVLKNAGQAGIPVLALKADMKLLDPVNPGKHVLDACDSLHAAFTTLLRTHPHVVMLVDQVDALSQSLSNDREQIKAYLSLIDRFLGEEYRDIRIIASCRKFDLHHDPLLNRWKDKKIIELQELSADEVKKLLSGLTGEAIGNQYSDTTLELLRTPQHLDIFCRIYRRNPRIHNYRTLQELYDELWNYYIYSPGPGSGVIDAGELEKFVFSVAGKIHGTETLTPHWLISGADKKRMDYLQSEGLITYDGSRIRFFHQNFYDYVYARWYTSENKSLCDDLCQEHQGFFVRSTVKQVLCYIREHDEDNYKLQLREILFSGKIRFHLCLLTLQLLAPLQDISPFEKQTVLELSEKAPELFNVLIGQSLSLEWFDILHEKLKDRLIVMEDEGVKENSILLFTFAQFAAHRQKTVFDTIGQIQSPRVKLIAAEQALWSVRDFSLPYIVGWYHKVMESRPGQHDINILAHAAESNPRFVCLEIKRLFDMAMPHWKEDQACEELIRYDFFDNLCKPVVEKFPLLIYPCIRDTVFKFIEATRYSSREKYLTFNYAFGRYVPESDNHHLLIDWMTEILSKQSAADPAFVRDEIETLLKSNDSTLLSVAFRVMASEPPGFTTQFMDLLENQKLVAEILGNGDQEYYFRELLYKSYDSFTPGQQAWLQNYVLEFSTSTDRLPAKGNRQSYRARYPNLGVNQQKLLHSLPLHAITPGLKRKMQEADRRNGSRGCKNTQPDHSVTMASFCGGLVSKDRYLLFTPEQWYKSFIKCEDGRWNIRNDTPFDVDVHARMFGECAEQNPEKHFPFVKRIVADREVHPRYKIAGLEGLAAAGFEIEELKQLFFRLVDSEIPERQEYDLVKIAGLFLIKSQTDTERIINYLYHIATRPYKSKYTPAEEEQELTGHTIIHTPISEDGLRSIQGRAIDELIESCSVKENRLPVYHLLTGLHKQLCPELKLAVLFYIKLYHDPELFGKLFRTYLTDPLADFVLIRSDAINQYLHNDPTVVLPYLRSVADHPRAQPQLGSLLFLGWGYGCQECGELLTDLLDKSTGAVVSCLSTAAKNINDARFTEKSLSVLNRYSTDPRQEIASYFPGLFHGFGPGNFRQVQPILDNLLPGLPEEKHYQILRYLEKCCADYPDECYRYLQSMIQRTGNVWYHDRGLRLELLLAIYKYLKKGRQSDPILDEIMDTFDLMLKQQQKPYRLEEILKEVDRM